MIKHFLSICESIQSRVYSADTGELLSFAKMTLDEAGLQKKREWVGLTDAEMKQTCYEACSYDPYTIARAIEAKLKEKNNG